MPPTSPSPDVRDLLRERLDTLLDECNQVMDNADYGQTIHDLDDFMLIAGKKIPPRSHATETSGTHQTGRTKG